MFVFLVVWQLVRIAGIWFGNRDACDRWFLYLNLKPLPG
jgi:hypothetical protein